MSAVARRRCGSFANAEDDSAIAPDVRAIVARAAMSGDRTAKAIVALAAMSGEGTAGELASDFGIPPDQVTKWKDELMREATTIFGREKVEARK